MRGQITVGRDLDISDRCLFSRIGVLHQDSSPQGERLSPLPKEYRKNRYKRDSEKSRAPHPSCSEWRHVRGFSVIDDGCAGIVCQKI